MPYSCPTHNHIFKSSVGNCYYDNFSLKISDVFFQSQALFWPYLRNGWSDWCETNRKYIGGVLAIICDLELWPHSWPWPRMSQDRISKWLYLKNCWSDWCEMKGSELIGYWAVYMALLFDHTHDLDLGVSRSESEIALSQEWDHRLTCSKKDVSHPFMTMILTIVTMVGWADLPDNDGGGFRLRRAVGISSFFKKVIDFIFNISSRCEQV